MLSAATGFQFMHVASVENNSAALMDRHVPDVVQRIAVYAAKSMLNYPQISNGFSLSVKYLIKSKVAVTDR